MSLRILFFGVAFALGAPAVAQPRSADEVQRLEIAHLKETIAQLKETIKLVEQKNDQLRAADDKRNEQRFDAQEKAVAAALSAAKEAVLKAEVASDKRFESVNEFRNQLKDQSGTFITRLELWGFLIGAVGLVLGIVTLYGRLFGKAEVIAERRRAK